MRADPALGHDPDRAVARHRRRAFEDRRTRPSSRRPDDAEQAAPSIAEGHNVDRRPAVSAAANGSWPP
jgi:hypothetical protein